MTQLSVVPRPPATIGPSARRLRIAFVTNEFVTEKPDAGGLGNYLNRITRSLHDLGHEVEVFTLALDRPSVIDHGGIRVESAAPPLYSALGAAARGRGPFGLACGLVVSLIHAILWIFTTAKALFKAVFPATATRLHWVAVWFSRFGIPRPLSRVRKARAQARALAEAFHRRHALKPFDFVQSANCGLCGMLIQPGEGVPHLLRLSSSRELWLRTENKFRWSAFCDLWLYCQLERRSIRRATRAYAPSEFLSHYFQREFRLPVSVLRPPAAIETRAANVPIAGLPPRYMIHFGSFRRAKGSDVLARALPLVWREEPEFTMVWAGREFQPGTLDEFRLQWGEQASRVVYVGPLRKPDLYNVLRRAVAAVLPSRVDNLPNTVIESLLHHVPVIGTRGSSVDELFAEGPCGSLVPIDDAEALAAAMLQWWREPIDRDERTNFTLPDVFDEMEPERAARRLIELAIGARSTSKQRRAA